MVRMLLQRGASVNAQGPDGLTALMCAVGNGNTTIVQVLLDAKADASQLEHTNDGDTVLMSGTTSVVWNTLLKTWQRSKNKRRPCPLFDWCTATVLAFAHCYNASCRRFCVLRFPKGRISGHVTVPAGLGAAGRHNKIITFRTSAHQPGRAS